MLAGSRAAIPHVLAAQERGAPALGELVAGLGVSARVLVIGAHPDDEDTRLIVWVGRGRHADAAYLSLTRGDGGQNLIGNELGEALGVIRTEELLAARRVDGGRQFFTRAYDFGFSKNAEEAWRHWPRDSLLQDVVRVVREFRPHVIVSVFSGTAADGHGQHTVSGLLARDVYDAAADSVRFPVSRFGAPWTPLKFYRSANFGRVPVTLEYNAGEYSPLLGRGYAEIAAESRSQHRSQAFGSLQRKGALPGRLSREATRVNAATDARAERSIFDGIDTSWARVRASLDCTDARAALDTLMVRLPELRARWNPYEPSALVAPLLEMRALAVRVGCAPGDGECRSAPRGACRPLAPDAATSMTSLRRRLDHALVLALGIAAEAVADRERVALGDTMSATITVYDRGPLPIRVVPAGASPLGAGRLVAPDSAISWAATVRGSALTAPGWLSPPRTGDLFSSMPTGAREAERVAFDIVVDSVAPGASTLAPADRRVRMFVAPTYRFADPVRGEINQPVAIVPALSVTLDRATDYARATIGIERQVNVQVRSAVNGSRDVRVALRLPAGLTADSAARTMTLPAYGSVRNVVFTVHGRLPAGRHVIRAMAESNGERFTAGYVPVEYEHIRPQQLYRAAELAIQAVAVTLPPKLEVAYIQGVGDNSAPVLRQLGVPVTMLDPAALSSADLSRYTTVVVGPRAYESSEALRVHNAVLLDFVKRGGTLVVQYGQYEMQTGGLMPFPITLSRPADRVTDENSPVQTLDAGSRLLAWPNVIGAADYAGWVQDRSLYMPRTHDPSYAAPISTSDPGEPPNDGGILVAKYGQGTYVYTTLAFFRQLPAGVPGAARLFVNVLSAGMETPAPATP